MFSRKEIFVFLCTHNRQQVAARDEFFGFIYIGVVDYPSSITGFGCVGAIPEEGNAAVGFRSFFIQPASQQESPFVCVCVLFP